MKKRYFVSLEQELTDQFKADLETLNLPKGTFSNLMNEWLSNFAPVLRQLADRKLKGSQLSFNEIMGTVVEEMGKSLKS